MIDTLEDPAARTCSNIILEAQRLTKVYTEHCCVQHVFRSKFHSKFGPWTKSQAGFKLPGTMEEYTLGSKAKQVFVKQNRQAMRQ